MSLKTPYSSPEHLHVSEDHEMLPWWTTCFWRPHYHPPMICMPIDQKRFHINVRLSQPSWIRQPQKNNSALHFDVLNIISQFQHNLSNQFIIVVEKCHDRMHWWQKQNCICCQTVGQGQNNIQMKPWNSTSTSWCCQRLWHDVQNIRRKHRSYASACLIITFYTITLFKGFSLIYRNFAFEFNNWLPVSCSVWWFSENFGHYCFWW